MFGHFLFMLNILVWVTCLSLPLQGAPNPLRVGIIINERLPSIDEEQIKDILRHARKEANQVYSLNIEYTALTTHTMAGYFEPYREIVLNKHKIFQYALNIDGASIMDLQRALLIEYGQDSLESLLPFVRSALPELGDRNFTNKIDLMGALAELQVQKLSQLKAILLEDGQPLLGGDNLHQFMLWWFYLREQEDFDVIITNQLLASAETFHPEIHGAARGGVATGFAGPSYNRYGGAALVSLFPIISSLDFFESGRGGNYSSEEVVESASAILLHELLHLLRHEKHQWSHPHCIMNPTPGFRYREWAADIRKNGPCLEWHDPSPFLQRTFAQFRVFP